MASKKYHYYVLVITATGPVYVTSNDWSNRTSHWEKDKQPLEMSQATAQDITLGLNWNGHLALTIQSQWEIDTQPYRYEDYEVTLNKI